MSKARQNNFHLYIPEQVVFCLCHQFYFVLCLKGIAGSIGGTFAPNIRIEISSLNLTISSYIIKPPVKAKIVQI